jgi:hypothetical protein
LRNGVIKSDDFFSAIHPLSNRYIKEVPERGMCPLLFGGLKRVSRPPHLQENFGLVRG